MATVGGFWAEEGHYMVWERALQRLGSTTLSGGHTVWLGLRRYPATLLFYALGLGALAADRLRFVGRVFAASLRNEDSGQVPAVSVLPASCATDGREIGTSGGYGGTLTFRLSDWIHDTLRPHVERIIPSDVSYSLVFDKLEILMALGYERHRHDDGDRPPIGAFIHRSFE